MFTWRFGKLHRYSPPFRRIIVKYYVFTTAFKLENQDIPSQNREESALFNGVPLYETLHGVATLWSSEQANVVCWRNIVARNMLRPFGDRFTQKSSFSPTSCNNTAILHDVVPKCCIRLANALDCESESDFAQKLIVGELSVLWTWYHHLRKVLSVKYHHRLTLSLPRVINFKFPLQPHTVWRTWLFIAIQMKDDFSTNSHCLTYTLKGWGNVLFALGSERGKRTSFTVSELTS